MAENQNNNQTTPQQPTARPSQPQPAAPRTSSETQRPAAATTPDRSSAQAADRPVRPTTTQTAGQAGNQTPNQPQSVNRTVNQETNRPQTATQPQTQPQINPEPEQKPAPSLDESGNEAIVSELTAAQENENTEELERTAEINENTGAEAEVNETPNFNDLSVSEQQDYLNILEEKNKQGILSVTEKALLDQAEENKNKSNEKTGDLGRRNGDENEEPDADKKGPFKEKDVIQYMYEDWLLEGANWCWEQCAKKIDKGFYAAERRLRNWADEKKLEKNKTYETETRHKLMEDHALSSGQGWQDLLDKKEEAQLKNLQLLKEGKYNQANVSPTTKVLFANMDEKEKKDFFKVADQGIKNYYSNIAAIEQIANNYVRAGMTLDLAQNKDYYQGQNINKEFDNQKLHAMKLIARRLDYEIKSGGNPQKLMGKLLNESQSASKLANKTIDKRKFMERNKKPKSGLSSSVLLISDTMKEVNTPEMEQQRGFYETAMMSQNFDQGMERSQEQLNRAFAANLVQKDQNNDRRDRVALFKQKLGLTNENIDTMSKLANQTRQQANNAERNQNLTNNLAGMTILGRMGADR